jgi:hypothetical protein
MLVDLPPSRFMSTKMEHGLSKNQILTELTKSPHGKLSEYVNIGRQAALTESEFFAHLISWNHIKGQIRDSKVALPVVALTTAGFPAELRENALAHLALLDPRNLVRAIRFSREIREPGKSGKNAINKMVKRYLEARVASRAWFDKNAVQHRRSLKELYALTHLKPSESANVILFGRGTDKVAKPYPRGSVFEAISQLKDMSPSEAAGTILNRKIPFLIAKGALGAKAKDPDIVLALINQMSATELVTNSKMLQKLGVRTNPALRGAYEAALGKAGTSKQNTLKTSRAAEALSAGEDDGLAEKLRALQEKQINALGGIDGSWLILADKSGSMSQAIEAARQVAATLARFVKGEVHLVFFDTAPRYVRATGKTLEQIKAETWLITAGGGTSVGCGLVYAIEKGLVFDGIAIISDGGENTAPLFPDTYARMVKATDRLLPVYLYQCSGEHNNLSPRMAQSGLDVQTFDLRGSKMDYYSLPALVQTMRVNRYSLVDEIMETPLLTLDEVFGVASAVLSNVERKEELAHA